MVRIGNGFYCVNLGFHICVLLILGFLFTSRTFASRHTSSIDTILLNDC